MKFKSGEILEHKTVTKMNRLNVSLQSFPAPARIGFCPGRCAKWVRSKTSPFTAVLHQENKMIFKNWRRIPEVIGCVVLGQFFLWNSPESWLTNNIKKSRRKSRKKPYLLLAWMLIWTLQNTTKERNDTTLIRKKCCGLLQETISQRCDVQRWILKEEGLRMNGKMVEKS